MTRSQLTAFAMDTAGLIAPDGVAMIKKIGERKAAVTSMGMAESRVPQSQVAESTRGNISAAHGASYRCDAEARSDARDFAGGLQRSSA